VIALCGLLLLNDVNSFSAMKMSANQVDSRRAFLNNVAATTTAVVASGFVTPSPALAVGGQKKVDAKLKGYGLPAAIIPNGLTPLCYVYGKGANRFPILVTFSHPFDWVVTTPSNDVNGEDGTIQAGEYGTGDTATFYVDIEAGSVENIESKDKEFFSKSVIRAISQKGDNMYQNFKITNVEEGQSGFGGQKYMIVDFKYELLTGAGFEVDRRGVASITSQGKAVEVLWCASTRQRYKKLEQTLRNIASSFRCYTDGLNFSEELIEA